MNVAARERLAVVGESGSGKSVTALAVLGLVQSPGRIMRGSIRWRGRDMRDPQVARGVRGKEISMIFQDPMTSLNPLMTIERQITEVLVKRVGMPRSASRARAIELLEMVGIPFPKERLKQYPYEFSGGMRQRVMIAIALAAEPMLLIADEPTTALDVTIQAQILDLLRRLSDELEVAVMMITHDLGVVAEFCDRVQVMYAGKDRRAEPRSKTSSPIRSTPTRAACCASSPRLDIVTDRLEPIAGDPPEHANAVSGCPFHPRCPEVFDRCREEEPALIGWRSERRWVACWNRQDDVRP